MDRNEKQNSFRNIQNSRGRDRKLKKYQTAFHISLAAAVIFAGSTGVLGFQYLNLRNQDTKTEENAVTADADNEKEENQTASADKKEKNIITFITGWNKNFYCRSCIKNAFGKYNGNVLGIY